ncbi:MAG: phage integrase N-terminal SAM-like domain-containing protein [Haloarculaceae archaeon]
MTHKDTKIPDGIKIVPETTKDRLNQRQLLDYTNHREQLTSWLLHVGKNPEKAEGYSPQTLKYRCYRIDRFYRWVWDEEDRYTTEVTPSHADDFMEELAYSDYSNTHKDNCQKALKMLFKWRVHELGGDSWSPERSFSTSNFQARDYFTMEERRKLREAALEYGSIPGYNDLTPKKRDKWKAYLAQRLMKPKEEVTPRDWKKANGWKTPSMVWVSLDAGLGLPGCGLTADRGFERVLSAVGDELGSRPEA